MSPQSRPVSDKSGYLSNDSIAAVSSALGGAVAVIRLSGPEVFSSIEKVIGKNAFRKAKKVPRTLIRAELFDNKGKKLDSVLLAAFPSPASYTGEDVIEIHTHGSPFIAARILEDLRELGIRQALPGEFSFRAVRNGKLTLSQAEAVADLISASNDGALSLAHEKISGGQSRQIEETAETLRHLAMICEAGIDFSDQDIPEVRLENLKDKLTNILKLLTELKSGFSRGRLIQEGISVALIGLPNSGKSSLFNAFLGEDRAIVSAVPGTTRDVIREHLTLQGRLTNLTFRLEDTAGIRKINDEVERFGIEKAQASARNADIILFIVDPKMNVSESIRVLNETRLEPDKTLGVITKADLISSQRSEEIITELKKSGIREWLVTSAVNGNGVAEAAEKLVELGSKLVKRDPNEVLLTRKNQFEAVCDAVEHLKRAKDVEERDLFAADIRHALYSLSPLIGDTVPDDILGKIFAEFCIGK